MITHSKSSSVASYVTATATAEDAAPASFGEYGLMTPPFDGPLFVDTDFNLNMNTLPARLCDRQGELSTGR